MAIRYLVQKDIDYTRWDRCIDHSLNGEIYVFSWFLDAIAGTWDAIIEDDYEAVMPLVYTKKLNFKIVYTHPLIKHLGIFSGLPIKADKISLFLKAIPVNFKKIEICFNRQNTQTIKESFSNYRFAYELDLITPYKKKERSYSDRVKKAIDFTSKMKLSVMKHTSIFELDFLLHQSPYKISESTIINPLLRVLARLISLNKAEIFGIYGPENMLYAAACFIRSSHNVVMLYAHTIPQGDISYANYLLLDSFLQHYSGRNVTLSFEHIDKYWNDEFYTAFGALRSYQYCYYKSRLIWPFRWFI